MNGTTEGVTYRLPLWPEGNGLTTYRAVGFANPKAGHGSTVPTESASHLSFIALATEEAMERSTVPAESAFFRDVLDIFSSADEKIRLDSAALHRYRCSFPNSSM